MALLAIAGLAATVILVREILGFLRIGRMARVRKDADSAIRQNDAVLARRSLAALRTTFAGRPEMTWGLNRLTEHERGIHDAADLLRLAERDLLVPIDADARRAVVQSAKRIATVTALSPMATLTIGFVMAENLRMLRRLATLYGGRPGMLGGLRLARLVVMHIILTGGMALTDDLLGQFLGQDLARRLSRRLGEGVFNGTLAARVGTAAIDVCRPLPFIDAPALRLRDLVTEIFKRGT
jgi:putative membrane protein